MLECWVHPVQSDVSGGTFSSASPITAYARGCDGSVSEGEGLVDGLLFLLLVWADPSSSRSSILVYPRPYPSVPSSNAALIFSPH